MPRAPRPLAVLTALTATATAVVTLGPADLVETGRDVTEHLVDARPVLLAAVDGFGGVEPAGNLVLFVPLAALVALTLPVRLLPAAFLVLLAAPAGVEAVQHLLPGRVPDVADVILNTTGLVPAFLGVALLRLLARAHRRLSRRAGRRRPAARGQDALAARARRAA